MTTLRAPSIDGRASLARLLARHTAVNRYEQHAQKRASEHGSSWHGRIWAGVAADYRRELHDLERRIDAKQQRAAAAA